MSNDDIRRVLDGMWSRGGRICWHTRPDGTWNRPIDIGSAHSLEGSQLELCEHSASIKASECKGCWEGVRHGHLHVPHLSSENRGKREDCAHSVDILDGGSQQTILIWLQGHEPSCDKNVSFLKLHSPFSRVFGQSLNRANNTGSAYILIMEGSAEARLLSRERKMLDGRERLGFSKGLWKTFETSARA